MLYVQDRPPHETEIDVVKEVCVVRTGRLVKDLRAWRGGGRALRGDVVRFGRLLRRLRLSDERDIRSVLVHGAVSYALSRSCVVLPRGFDIVRPSCARTSIRWRFECTVGLWSIVTFE